MSGVDPDPNPSAADDEAVLARHAATLADGVVSALPRWVERCVADRLEAWSGPVHGDPRSAASEAGEQAAREVGPRIRALLSTDVDDQRANPLALVRDAVAFPTEVLRAAGVPPVVRDAEAERLFPGDPYDLTPGSFAELDPDLADLGIVWGAAKAHVVLRRRRAEGQR